MKFKLINPDAQFGHDLFVVAETPKEVVELYKHFRLADTPDQILAMAESIQVGTFSHIVKTEKRRYYDVDVYLDRALEPYRKLLKEIAGYDGGLPNMDLTHIVPNRLGHTHITNSAEIVDGQYHAEVYQQAEPWNGMEPPRTPTRWRSITPRT